jgi:hypothetical protein
LSKKHGASKKRKKAARKRTRSKSTASRLAALADALNACEAAGLRIRFAHGAAFCDQGVVLPPAKKGQGWAARLFRVHPHGRPAAGGDDD